MVGFGTTTLHEDVTTTAPEGVNLSANQIVLDGLAIAASEGGVRLDGAVDLTGNVDIAASDSIVFEGAVTSSNGLARSLTLATDANVEFRDTVGDGAANQLGAITIATAVDVTASASIQAASLVQLEGFGTTLLQGDVTTSEAAGVDLTTGLVILEGITITIPSEPGGGTVRFTSGRRQRRPAITRPARSCLRARSTRRPPTLTLTSPPTPTSSSTCRKRRPGNALRLDHHHGGGRHGLRHDRAASFTQLVGFGTTTLHEDVTTTGPRA